MLIATFLLYSMLSSLFSTNLDKFLQEAFSKSRNIKQLTYSHSLNSSAVRFPSGRYDFILGANLSYMDQSGALMGNFMLDTYKSTEADIFFQKKFSFGLSAKLSHKYSHIEMNYSFSPQAPAVEGYNPVTSINLSLPLLNNILGANDRRELDIIEAKLDIEDNSFRSLKNKFIKDILALYLNVYSLKENIRVSAVLKRTAEILYRVSLRKLRIGALAKRHLLASRANLDDTDNKLSESKRAFEVARKNLEVLSGFNIEQYLNGELDTEYLRALIKKAKTASIDNYILKQYEAELRIANLELETAKNKLLPNLELFGSYSLGNFDSSFSSAYTNMFDKHGYTVGINFVWDIGGTSKRLEHTIKNMQQKITKLKYEQYKEDLDRSIEILDRILDTLHEEYKRAELSYKAQEQRQRLEMQAFKRGKSRVNDVIDAQRAYAYAGLNRIRLKSAIIQNAYELMYLKGVDLLNYGDFK